MTWRSKIPVADIARRITGISTPVFGVSWNPPENKRDIVRRLIAFLEDRRALYAERHMEYGPWVEKSVIEMRQELTDILQDCPEDKHLTAPIRAMRAACRKFLERMDHPDSNRRMVYPKEARMWEALGELRAIFGLHLARLCTGYGVDVEADLTTIFPAEEIEEEQS